MRLSAGSVIAGNGTNCVTAPACGDGRPATAAQLRSPTDVAVDAAGDVYIADSADAEVRKVPDGITRVAGDGTQCSTAPACGDGGPAVAAQLGLPQGIALSGGRRRTVAGRLRVTL